LQESIKKKDLKEEEVEAIQGYILNQVKNIQKPIKLILKTKPWKKTEKAIKSTSVLSSKLQEIAETMAEEDIENTPNLLNDAKSTCEKIIKTIDPLIEK